MNIRATIRSSLASQIANPSLSARTLSRMLLKAQSRMFHQNGSIDGNSDGPVARPSDPQHLQEYFTSTLDNIKLPHNPQRYFTFTEPVNYKKHYCIPSHLRISETTFDNIKARLQRSNVMVKGEKMFGKTGFAYELADYLNLDDNNAALYISLKANVGAGDDVNHALHLIYDEINSRAKAVFDIQIPFRSDPVSNTLHHLEDLIRTVKMKLDERGLTFHLLIDDAQATNSESLYEFLRILNLMDCGERIGPETVTLLSTKDLSESVIFSEVSKRFEEPSEFQGLASFELSTLTFDHVRALAKSYEKATDRVFQEPALNRIMFLSNGHPWIVNRLFSQLTKSRTLQDVTIFDVDHVVLAADEVDQDKEPYELIKALRETRALKFTSS